MTWRRAVVRARSSTHSLISLSPLPSAALPTCAHSQAARRLAWLGPPCAAASLEVDEVARLQVGSQG